MPRAIRKNGVSSHDYLFSADAREVIDAELVGSRREHPDPVVPVGPGGLRAVGAAERPLTDTRTCRERAAWVGKRRDKETTRSGEGVPPSVEPLTRASGRARHGTLEQN